MRWDEIVIMQIMMVRKKDRIANWFELNASASIMTQDDNYVAAPPVVELIYELIARR